MALKAKLFLKLMNSQQEKGFTLIELLVVVIIVGVLAAIALPNLLAQIGKGRESEMKNAIGTINRAQQAYHWEFQVFASGATALTNLQVNLSPKFIDEINVTSADPKGANPASATVVLTNNEAVTDGTRALSGGTYYRNGGYATIVCITDNVTVNGVAPQTAGGLSCSAGTSQLK